MIWPWRRREAREAVGDYTDQRVDELLRYATSSARTEFTAMVAAAAGLWGRTISGAEVSPMGRRTRAVTPGFLSTCAHELAIRGEALYLIRVMGGAVKLIPSSYHTVNGDDDPDDWTYVLNTQGPTGSPVVRVRAAEVVHVRYLPSNRRPWEGVSPLEAGGTTARLLAELEASLADEAGGPRGSVVPVSVLRDETSQPRREQILSKLRGAVALFESNQFSNIAPGGGSQASGGSADWAPRRFGPNPPAGAVQLRKEAAADVAAAFGCSAGMLRGDGAGTGTREDWREFLSATARPLAGLIAAELAAKLDAPVTLDLAPLEDVGERLNRARLFRTLVGREKLPGLDIAAARRIAGL